MYRDYNTARKGNRQLSASRTSTKWCPECGLKVRSANHTEGSHHKTKRS